MPGAGLQKMNSGRRLKRVESKPPHKPLASSIEVVRLKTGTDYVIRGLLHEISNDIGGRIR